MEKFETPNNNESDLDSGIDKENMVFDITPEEVEEKYGLPSDEININYRNGEWVKPDWEVDRLFFKDMEESVKQYINEYNEGQDYQVFFDNLKKTAEAYNSYEFEYADYMNNPEFVLAFAKLWSGIKQVEFIKDPRSIDVMEVLANDDKAAPYEFNMYVDYKKTDFEGNIDDNGGYGKYFLKEGISIDDISILEQYVDDNKLWEGKSQEIKRIFLSNIAEVVEHLTKIDSSKTLPVRLKLLRINSDLGSIDEFSYHLVYTFKSEEDKKELQGIIDKEPESDVGKMAKDILSGKYEGVAWAI